MQRCPPHSATTATICPYHECNRFIQQVSSDPTAIACNTETRPYLTYRVPQLLFFSMKQRRSVVYRVLLKRSTAPHPQSPPHSRVFFRTLFSGLNPEKRRTGEYTPRVTQVSHRIPDAENQRPSNRQRTTLIGSCSFSGCAVRATRRAK